MSVPMKRICTICARSGSKGIPGKNIKPLLGLPLIAHSITQAKQSGLFDLIAVDSDGEDILSIAREHGADLTLKRPADLASDDAGKLAVIQRAVSEAETRSGLRFDTLVDLDATSPLRAISDIEAAITLVEEGDAGNAITGSPARRSPYFNLVEEQLDGHVALAKSPTVDLVRRQDTTSCYDMNASVYVWQREPFLSAPYLFDRNTRIHVMPLDRSWDIDEPLDFEIVEFLMQRRREQIS